MSDVVRQRFQLTMQWPTFDPFLFCVHHDDAYPAANSEFGPSGSLAGRAIGNDFEGIDGWRMYHGQRIAGFPPHPHRGFETVTYVRRGLIDHSDSLGAKARFGRGDVQWLTAGRGIVHSEMFPLLDQHGPNPLELFQIWLNLASDDKFADPYFSMLWDDDIPRVTSTTEIDGRLAHAEVTLIAGEWGDVVPPPPPPSSWAARPSSDVAIWHVRLDPGARCALPSARSTDTLRTVYAFEGGAVTIDGGQGTDSELIELGSGAVVRADVATELVGAGHDHDVGSEVLILQGRPIGERVAQYGPFVMNDDAGIEQTIADYRETGFGGWPWPSEELVHGADPARFAVRPDGTLERAGAA
ncbi:MAG: pirin family protein [Acidimicrobiia bacterium]